MAAVVFAILAIWLKSHAGNFGSSQGNRTVPANQSDSSSVLGGSYDLSRDENIGGHTLKRHVGRTDDQLRERLDRERDISAASTYTDRAAAERTVAAALARDHDRVQAWLNRTDAHPNLPLRYHSNTQIGRSIRRGEQTAEPCSSAIIVLRYDGEQRFHVLTTYPETERR